jgi:NADPH-dependent curcumin reductase CurA
MKTKLAALTAILFIGSLYAPAPTLLAKEAPSAQTMMKAAVLVQLGGPENFKCEQVPRPMPKDDEVLVKVMAASVNPVDTYMRKGNRMKSASDNRPIILGYDIAGTIVKTGAGIKGLKAGDPICRFRAVAVTLSTQLRKKTKCLLSPGTSISKRRLRSR